MSKPGGEQPPAPPDLPSDVAHVAGYIEDDARDTAGRVETDFPYLAARLRRLGYNDAEAYLTNQLKVARLVAAETGQSERSAAVPRPAALVEAAPETLPSLEQQYALQVAVLEEAGLVKRGRGIPKGIRGVDGKLQRLPDQAEVLESVERPAFAQKRRQGFTELLLPAAGVQLNRTLEGVARVLRQVAAIHRLVDYQGNSLRLDRDRPLADWMDLAGADKQGRLISYPKRLHPRHGGLTKAILCKQGNTVEVLLVEPLAELPRGGEGSVIGGRHQLKTGRTPTEYLEKLSWGEHYAGESGMTLEAYLMLLATRAASGRPLPDTETVSRLPGSFDIRSGKVPVGYWSTGVGRGKLDADLPGDQSPSAGLRPEVKVPLT